MYGIAFYLVTYRVFRSPLSYVFVVIPEEGPRERTETLVFTHSGTNKN